MGYAETVQRVLQGSYDDASPTEKAAAAREIVQVCSIAAAAATIQPFPFLDFAIITPIQVGLVRAVGKIHGRKLDQQAVLELLASLGASIKRRLEQLREARAAGLLTEEEFERKKQEILSSF